MANAYSPGVSTSLDFTVENLGECRIPSPITLSRTEGDTVANYVQDSDRIIYRVDAREGEEYCLDPENLVEKAGPRENIYFHPGHVHAGILTCGGLCPGLNDVIRAITRCLWYRYSVRRISGIRFGYKGLLPDYNHPIVQLDPEYVDDIHKMGGSVLGSSRGGGERTAELVDSMERLNLNMLFVIGGDGTQKGALKIAEEIGRRGLKISVVGVPKTIDNDFSFIERSFGFETAVARATEVVTAAHAEAHSAIDGIGLVKVMGRDSGYIAAHTALASNEVNFVLIPEIRFDLQGPGGLLSALEKRLDRRGHAVIVVAEGAGQEHLEAAKLAGKGLDASGNRKLGDIGAFLKDVITTYFTEKGREHTVKYIDPSYVIRSAPPVANDAVYCARLGNNAVHAAMAGKTKLLLSLVHNHFAHLPVGLAVQKRARVDPESALWRDVIEATHQPLFLTNDVPEFSSRA